MIRWTTSTVFLPFLVMVRRTWATWAAPAKSIQTGAWTVLMVRGARRPWPRSVLWEATGTFCPGEPFERSKRRGLVGLDGEHVVRSGGGDRFRGLGLGVHRVDGDHASVQVSRVERGQQVYYCGELVCLGRDRRVAHDGSAGMV